MNVFPEGDDQFEDKRIDSVDKESDGTYAIGCDGWHLWCGKDCPVVPEVGQMSRQYGRGIGAPVRGLFINGVKVWYRTEAEDAEHREIQMYGADAAEWLARWDAGKGVWSIEMGGLGPGYEQCIQITAAEILRHLLDAKYDAAAWDDKDTWKRDRETIDKYGFANERVKALGLSGAQWGAAMSLATALYLQGPRKIMNDDKIKDRKIQVQRTFPVAA